MRRRRSVALLAAVAIAIVGLLAGGGASRPAEAQDDPSTTSTTEPATLSVSIEDLPATEWRPRGPVRSVVEGRDQGGDDTSDEWVDPGAATDAERSLEDLGATRTPEGLVVTLPETILFDFDSAELLGEAQPTIDQIAGVLAYHADVDVAVEGHTDSRGDDDYRRYPSAVPLRYATRSSPPASQRGV